MSKFFPTTGTFDNSRKFFIWGHPLEYSLSIFFQEHAAALAGNRIIYSPFRGEKPMFLELIKQDTCYGANITMPFKTEAVSICNELTANARDAGSVNTIYKRSGKLIGDNTDGAGLFKWMEIENLLKSEIQIIGNGGTARSIASYFFKKGIKTIICARSFKGWEKEFGDFVLLDNKKTGITTINTLPFPIEGDGILDISYKFGSVSRAAWGMLACQGALSAATWFNTEPLFDRYLRIARLHVEAHLNTRFFCYSMEKQ